MVSDPTHTTVVDEQFVRSKLGSFGICSNFSVGNLCPNKLEKSYLPASPSAWMCRLDVELSLYKILGKNIWVWQIRLHLCLCRCLAPGTELDEKFLAKAALRPPSLRQLPTARAMS